MILQSRLLQDSTPALHGFTLRDPEAPPDFGNASLVFGSPQEATGVRQIALAQMGLCLESLVLVEQVHGSQVHRVRAEDRGRGARRRDESIPGADGLICTLPNVAVGVLVADCCCLLLADVHGLSVAAVHAGWRGTLEGIAGKTVRMLQSECGIAPRDLRVWISPAISGKNYTVSQELWERFHREWGDYPEFLLREPYRIDLPKLNACQLLRGGVPAEGIEDAGLCTLTTECCFSHRRGDTLSGRMLGVIALPPSGFRRKPLSEG